MNITVLLVDDHRLVREALRQSLSSEDDIEVIGEAGSGMEALERLNHIQPQIVLLDIGLPDMNGIEVTQRLLQMRPGLKIVALSMYDDRRFVTEMVRQGVAAYVTKASAGTELTHAIRAVSEGKSYFSPDVANILAEQLRSEADGRKALGKREKEVLRLVALGKRSQDISKELNISVGTVDIHRRNIMRKLQIYSVAELTIYAIREGLITI